jgi:predicted N-acyltransferase
VAVHQDLRSVEREWRALADPKDLFLSVPYLRALEASRPANLNFRYLLFHEAGRPVGLAYCQLLTLHPARQISLSALLSHYARHPFRKWMLRLAIPTLLDKEYHVLVCGNMLLTGSAGFRFESCLSDETATDMLSQGLASVQQLLRQEGVPVLAYLVKDASAKATASLPFRTFGFRTVHFQPNMVLPFDPDWRSMEDYVRSLSSKYRVRYRKALRQASSLALRELDQDEIVRLQPRMMELFRSVSMRQDFNLLTLGDDYFASLSRHLGDRFRVFGYFSEPATLAGFFTLLRQGDELEGHFLGMDQDINRKHQLYLNMLYEMIRIGIECDASGIHYARTAPEIKSTVGAVPQILCNHLKIHHPLLHTVFPLLLRLLMPPRPWVQRNPFRSDLPGAVPPEQPQGQA